MRESDLLDLIARNSAKYDPEGNFILSSGKKSNWIFDLSLSLRSSFAMRSLGVQIMSMLPDYKYFNVGGPTSGADPVAASILPYAINAQWFSVRSEKKNHGFDRELITGQFNVNLKTVLVDDVLTTGESLLRAFDACTEVGMIISDILVVLDRKESEAAKRIFKKTGIWVRSVYTFSDVVRRKNDHSPCSG